MNTVESEQKNAVFSGGYGTASAALPLPVEASSEILAIQDFQRRHPGLFQKDDRKLFCHLGLVFGLMAALFAVIVLIPSLAARIPASLLLSLLYFSLINVTIHHHHTHRNAAQSPAAKKFLDLLYMAVLPNAARRRPRYVKVHLSHHADVFEPTDVDHLYGAERFLKMRRNLWTRLLYFLELSFVGAHVPGWEEDQYMNETPRDEWNLADYRIVKAKEKNKAVITAAIQGVLLCACLQVLPWFAWGWALPMLLVKNWAHFLGQFQHYDPRFLQPGAPRWKRTLSFEVPGWFNNLMAGEIKGHHVHHLFPSLPYYNMEEACKILAQDPEASRFLVMAGKDFWTGERNGSWDRNTANSAA
ncbi:MAG TPA: fatty acid desaturase [Verrucomicrobiae bacterium]|nr:fatty acid desaturase [Verrucomicrobiae bacterium]